MKILDSERPQAQFQKEAFFYHPTITGIVFPDCTLIPNKKLCEAMHIDNPTIGISVNIKDHLPLNICEQISVKIKSLTPSNPEIKTEFIVYTPDQQKRIIGSTLAGNFDQNGQLIFAIGTSKDITEIKKEQEKLEKMAIYDSLTGLFNRQFMEQIIEKMKYSREPVAAGFFDVDHFKDINEKFTHEGGDKHLQDVAKFLLSCFRESDYVCRSGGDEFVVLMEGIESDQDCLKKEEEIKTKLKALNQIRIKSMLPEIKFTFHISLAEPFFRYDIETAEPKIIGHKIEEAIKNADFHLMNSKNSRINYQEFPYSFGNFPSPDLITE